MYFYKNKKTGEVINSTLEINDDYFELLIENTTDGAFEKHVPIYSINDDKIFIKVGELEHPMEYNHYIMWIALVYDGKILIQYLSPDDKPEAVFDYKENATIYAYCNLHGLWKNTIK